jgi:hypothetical protein
MRGVTARWRPGARRRDRGAGGLPYGADWVHGRIAIQTRRGPFVLLVVLTGGTLVLAVGVLVALGSRGWPLAAVFAAWAACLAWVAGRLRSPAWVLDADGIDSRRWLARPVPWSAVVGKRFDGRYAAASPVWGSMPFLVVEAPGAVRRRRRRKVEDELWIPLVPLRIEGHELAALLERRGAGAAQ